jgi:hypothetical protein
MSRKNRSGGARISEVRKSWGRNELVGGSQGKGNEKEQGSRAEFGEE